MRPRLSAVALALVLSAACGGGSTGPTALVNGTFTAKVDGSNFSATTAIVTTAAANIISIGAGNAAGQSLGFGWVDAGPGTYTVGATSPTNAVYVTTGAGWVANVTGGSGSIVVTTRTSNRVVGTFSFVVIPSSGTASGNKTVTQGVFDLTF